MKKLIFIIILSLIFCTSCNKDKNVNLTSCHDILKNICDEENIKYDTIYSKDKTKGNDGYISDTLLLCMFNGNKEIFKEWSDIAFILPCKNEKYEICIIRCDSNDSINDASRILLNRAETLVKHQNKENLHSNVTVIKNYIIMTVGEDDISKTVKKCVKKA